MYLISILVVIAEKLVIEGDQLFGLPIKILIRIGRLIEDVMANLGKLGCTCRNQVEIINISVIGWDRFLHGLTFPYILMELLQIDFL